MNIYKDDTNYLIIGIMNYDGSIESKPIHYTEIEEKTHEFLFGFKGTFKRWRYMKHDGLKPSTYDWNNFDTEDWFLIENHLLREYKIKI